MEIKRKETKEAHRNMKKVALHRIGRCGVAVRGTKFPTICIIYSANSQFLSEQRVEPLFHAIIVTLDS